MYIYIDILYPVGDYRHLSATTIATATNIVYALVSSFFLSFFFPYSLSPSFREKLKLHFLRNFTHLSYTFSPALGCFWNLFSYLASWILGGCFGPVVVYIVYKTI